VSWPGKSQKYRFSVTGECEVIFGETFTVRGVAKLEAR
jgi:hypothetical protein